MQGAETGIQLRSLNIAEMPFRTNGGLERERERENEGDGGENSGEVLQGGRRKGIKGRRRDEDCGGEEDET